MLKKIMLVFCFLSVALGMSSAHATIEQVKRYQAAFDEKPKCACCHTDALPKKADGKHDLNEYGQKLKSAKTADNTYEDILTQVGKNEKDSA